MKRFARLAITMLSLLLGVGTSALWARSHRVGDKYEWQPRTADRRVYSSYVVCSGKGNLTFYRARSTFSRPLRPGEEDLPSYTQNELERGYTHRRPSELYKNFWPVTRVDTPQRFIVWHVGYGVKHDDILPPVGERYEWHTYACPHWAIVLIAAVPPALSAPRTWAWWSRRRQRTARGFAVAPAASPSPCPEGS